MSSAERSPSDESSAIAAGWSSVTSSVGYIAGCRCFVP
jgi:hypothetical protein